MTHISWLQVAERIDSLRVFPRLFLVACFWWVVATTWFVLRWYTQLPLADQSVQASGLAAVTLSGQMVFLKLVYQTYSDAGRNWNQQQPTTSTTLVQQTTATGTPP